MIRILHNLLTSCIRHGTLTIRLPDGTCLTAGDGTRLPLVVALADQAAISELIINPELALGELYMEGRLNVSGGTIHDVLDLLGRNMPNLTVPRAGRIRQALRATFGRLALPNSEARAKRNVQHHYDLDGRLYALFLDSDRQYSCGYFERGGESLDEAQLAKKRHIAAKLLVRPGYRVLDIGSGWGGLALYLADICGAQLTGVTLSDEQLAVSQRRVRQTGQAHVDFRLQDYRGLNEEFDRVVSVGMFEHVGPSNYDTFFNVVARSLRDDGVALLHTIGRLGEKCPTNPWFAKYIFPGGYVPSLSQVLASIEGSGLIETDVEILRLHYADTLAAWRSRFDRRRTEAVKLLGERFCRMWEFYLAAGEIGFRYGGLVVFQIQLAKQIDVVPRTRDYIASEEIRLRQIEGTRQGKAA